MDLKREPTRRAIPARYPSLDDVRSDRRRFLQYLGGSALALGLSACETATGPAALADAPAVDAGVDGAVLSGIAPPDVHEPDVWSSEPEIAGGMPAPDVVEPLPDSGPPSPGGMMEPDIVQPPPDTGLEPPMGGDLPAPDILQPPPDTGEPPLAGDLPWPEPDVVQPGPDAGPDTGEGPPIDGDLPAPAEP
jgi:hypothetical protein